MSSGPQSTGTAATAEQLQIYQLAYDAALSAVDDQERSLEQIRSRSGSAFAALTLAAGLISSSAVGEGGLERGPILAAALVLYVAAASLVVAIQFPLWRWRFAAGTSAGIIIDSYAHRDDVEPSYGTTLVELARWKDEDRRANKKQLRVFYYLLAGIYASLAADLTLWISIAT